MNLSLSNSMPEEYYDYYGTDDICESEFLDDITAGCVLLLVFALGVLGNGLVVYTLVRFEDLRSVSNLFFLCLASFDLLSTLTLLFFGIYYLHHWVFGDAACKIVTGAFFTGQYGSLLLLMTMALDRFCTVVLKGRPLAQPGRRLLCARVACVATWVISIVASIREAFTYETSMVDGIYFCEPGKVGDMEEKVRFYAQAVFFFLFPLVVIVFCYSCVLRTILSVPHMRGRQRTLVLLFCIVAAFFVCFVPYNGLIYLLMVLDMSNSETEKLVCSALEISLILAYCHCFVNSVLHLLRPRFRLLLYQVVCCMKPTSHPVSQPHINHDATEMYKRPKTTIALEVTLEQSESTNVF